METAPESPPQVRNLADKLVMLGFLHYPEFGTDWPDDGTWSDGEVSGAICWNTNEAWLSWKGNRLFVTGAELRTEQIR